MRFDDSLRTVLAADMAPGLGAQSAWRQLVDLAGRGRVGADVEVIARLRALRGGVPTPVRAASARALAFARPDAALVEFFAEDELAVAAPVLRTAILDDAAWLDLLPRLSPAGRSVLRGRRDLADTVSRGLESLGAVDFTLTHEGTDTASVAAAAPEARPPAIDTPRSPSPFVPLGEVARGLPLVAEALRRAEHAEPAQPRFEIADLVERIAAFNRVRETAPGLPRDTGAVRDFRFETDAAGVIRWVDGVARATLVGVSLAHAAPQGLARVDAAVAAAVRRRSRFAEGRLEVAGTTDAAGSWRIAGTPGFDAATGRFTGIQGIARRPARHERAERGEASDSLRQLVHELRTPANAVAGFAEFIESELLGPVPALYRARAGTIRGQAAALLGAIDDLDTAARLEGGALELRPGQIAIRPLLVRLVDELVPLAEARGAALVLDGGDGIAAADERATERLAARLLAALLSAALPGERLDVSVHAGGDRVEVAVARPRALADLAGDALFSLDGAPGDEGEGGPLLGAGFTLRLVRNLAAELGGALAIGTDRLTLRLPAAFTGRMGQASNN